MGDTHYHHCWCISRTLCVLVRIIISMFAFYLATEWLLHIRTILHATRMQISKMDQDKCSVVSHCRLSKIKNCKRYELHLNHFGATKIVVLILQFLFLYDQCVLISFHIACSWIYRAYNVCFTYPILRAVCHRSLNANGCGCSNRREQPKTLILIHANIYVQWWLGSHHSTRFSDGALSRSILSDFAWILHSDWERVVCLWCTHLDLKLWLVWPFLFPVYYQVVLWSSVSRTTWSCRPHYTWSTSTYFPTMAGVCIPDTSTISFCFSVHFSIASDNIGSFVFLPIWNISV